ncbi:MAG: hypothetical protein IPM90_07355 [Austwickia sp.]|nr:hypothetical protein [Austwickia sp.]
MVADLQAVELVAVIVAVPGGVPQVLTLGAPIGVPALPAGPLEADHRSLQYGLRTWVERQTGHPLGYVEQLYTFADRERAPARERVVSVSYLGLTRVEAGEPGWRDWYQIFPWEDCRDGRSDSLYADLRARLGAWAQASAPVAARRQARIDVAFGFGDAAWAPENCLQRYELLWEAGLVPEAPVGAGPGAGPGEHELPAAGQRLLGDHRRILATGIARLRAKLQYRPVVFELMPDTFTLGTLQLTVEALAGTRVHKQNFRRLVEQQHLVEPTGATTAVTGGRPAKVYRFRREILAERQAAGTKLPVPRSR